MEVAGRDSAIVEPLRQRIPQHMQHHHITNAGKSALSDALCDSKCKILCRFLVSLVLWWCFGFDKVVQGS